VIALLSRWSSAKQGNWGNSAVVRVSWPAGGEALSASCQTGRAKDSRPGIEFNAHCYQRREDATQPHCLAGLVTAGDIINRLCASHPRLPPDFVASRWKLTGDRSRMRNENAEFCIGKRQPFPGYAGFGYRRLSSSRKMEFLRCTIAERDLQCIYQKNEFAQGVPLNLQEK